MISKQIFAKHFYLTFHIQSLETMLKLRVNKFYVAFTICNIQHIYYEENSATPRILNQNISKEIIHAIIWLIKFAYPGWKCV